MRVHRLIIDSWPTPDGRPFRDVDVEVWRSATDKWVGGDGEWPDWLPEGLDLGNRIPIDGEPVDLAQGGYWVGGSNLVVIVPDVPRRRHYFSKSSAQRVLNLLVEWGCTGHIDYSEPIVWENV